MEEIRDRVDICFARAFASFPEAWAAAGRLLAEGGRLVYFAGAAWEGLLDAPPGGEVARVHVSSTGVLESAGPLVIMARR